MTDEPWNDEDTVDTVDLYSTVGAASILIGVLWSMIGYVIYDVNVALGLAGIFVSVGIAFLAAAEVYK